MAHPAEKCAAFLRSFQSPAGDGFKYLNMLQEIADRQRETLDIDLSDLEEHCSSDAALSSFTQDVCSNSRRYISLFAESADELMPERSYGVVEEDSFDVLTRQREQANPNADDVTGRRTKRAAADPETPFPRLLQTRRQSEDAHDSERQGGGHRPLGDVQGHLHARGGRQAFNRGGVLHLRQLRVRGVPGGARGDVQPNRQVSLVLLQQPPRRRERHGAVPGDARE
jgi:hypothetical protein